jgi:hypothetical protein
MEPVMQFSIEYECECDHGLCDHAQGAIKEAMQRAYQKGVEDGIRHTVAEIRSGMQQAPAKRKRRGELPPIGTKKKYSN